MFIWKDEDTFRFISQWHKCSIWCLLLEHIARFLTLRGRYLTWKVKASQKLFKTREFLFYLQTRSFHDFSCNHQVTDPLLTWIGKWCTQVTLEVPYQQIKDEVVRNDFCFLIERIGLTLHDKTQMSCVRMISFSLIHLYWVWCIE